MIIAVDTGGTKTLIAAFREDGAMEQIARFPTPRSTTEYIETIISTIRGYANSEPIDAIAVALPGIVRGNTLMHAQNLGWEQFDSITPLLSAFPTASVIIGNDADIAGLAEMRMRNPVPHTGMYLTFSTGIGGGLCFNGKLDSATAVFEAGAMRLQYEGSIKRWEDFASGRNFHERYGQYGSDVDDPEKWRDYAKRMAVGIQALIPVFVPDHVVIGGSMGTHFAKYSSFLHEALLETIPDDLAKTVISQANHPEEAVIYGCYYYALDELTR